MNLAEAWLEANSMTVDDFDGVCGELANALLHEHDGRCCDLLWIDFHGWNPEGWGYHMVAVIDGVVHDAWRPGCELGPADYIKSAFPGVGLRWEIVEGGDG